MKKFIAAAVAVALAASMSISAFAATSKSNAAEVSGVQAASGTVSASAIVRVEETSVKVTESEAKTVISASSDKTVSILDQFDLTAKDVAASQFPLTITFSVPGVTKDMDVKVLHFEDNAWKDVTVSVGDGTVTAKFASLSPVAIVKAEAAASTETTTSPKTGEADSAALLAFGTMLVACAGAVLVAKRKNA